MPRTPRPSRRPLLTALTAASVAALAAGCGSGKDDDKADAATQPSSLEQPYPPKAAEPIAGPPAVGKPLGQVVEVGAAPEGIDVDPQTHVVAVAVQDPARLVLVDGRTGKVTKEVPLPGTARHVTLAKPGGPFLVPAETADELVQVMPDGEVLSTTKVGDAPHDATWLDGTAYAGDEFGSTLSEVRDGKLTRQVPVDVQPGGVVAVGDDIAVSSVRAYTLELFGRKDLRGKGAQSGGLGPSHVKADADGRLYVADTRGQQLIVYGTRPRQKFLKNIPLGGTPLGLAVDDRRGRIWVSLSERNELVALTLSDEPRELDRVATVRAPYSNAVDVDTGRLFITSRTDGTLQLIDP